MPLPRQEITAQFHQGFAYFQANRLHEAEMTLRGLLMAAPDHADSLHLLGIIGLQSGHHDQAAGLFSRALRHAPANADLQWNFGAALQGLGRTDEALACYRKALRLKPGAPELHRKLGTVLHNLERPAEAVGRYQKALQINPGDAEAHHDLAVSYKALGRTEAALAEFRTAVQLAPSHAGAHYNLGIMALLLGQLEEGWREYEWRWQMPRFEGGRRLTAFPRWDYPQDAWDGTPLRGRRVLVHAEQGLGDTLQFCRFLPQLAREAEIVLFASKQLTRLLSTLGSVEHFVSPDDALPSFDVYCSLMSLPGLLGVTLETLPVTGGYLAADPAATARWTQRLAAYPGLRVGLAWAGNPTCTADAQRSVTLEQMSELAQPGVTFVSLQKMEGGRPDTRQMPGLLDWTEELGDFADTAALITALDLVISVDTAVVHLAGALGKPVWLLNRFDPCWRWLLGCEDSPWYPTLRQFRQPEPGDWANVVTRIRTALAHMTAISPQAIA